MKRLMLLVAGVVLAVVPAVFGLTDNPPLSHRVPVRIPAGTVPAGDAQVADSGDPHTPATPTATAPPSPDTRRCPTSVPEKSSSGQKGPAVAAEPAPAPVASSQGEWQDNALLTTIMRPVG
jgi:hypothetical protein